ncbi:MAG: NAD(P)H-dependent oxidoreductase [Methanospirillum sp.]|uniref:NAD(P)H-dependent oxidoreductase n=1 Tax=Methanospirillum sp. TaxID=45200 RepID=UPI00236E761F|nr:NAD(P)H-dependent oxidoreductase [Methanospirillum sp.]MDD1729598.1 NAD(P)H-dependent oxidoreductase [Methanospirillum sp.]
MTSSPPHTITDEKNTWLCTVCGFQIRGIKPPKGCPNCHSPSGEFIPEHKEIFSYNDEPFDVLLINGSSHRAGNTGLMTDIAEEILHEKSVSYKRFNLNEFSIDHCWCCYAVRAQSCDFPCRNRSDDMHTFHQMLHKAKAVIIASPINWNSMSARLKIFLDRTTCMQNLYHLNKTGLTDGKIVGILVNGHEDGGIKTAMDIFLNFQQMGFILAPFGISYRTHGAEYSSNEDRNFFKTDQLLREHTRGVVSNVVELMKLDLEHTLKGRIIPVSE